MHSELSKELAQQILVIDTEASGLDPLYHSILSIGLCTLDKKLELTLNSSLAEHDLEMGLEIFVDEGDIKTDPRAMAIHGITLELLKEKGKSPLDACLLFEDFISTHFTGSVILAGHNINFDISFMKRLYRVAKREWPKQISHRVVDTHSLLWGLAFSQKIPKTACSSDGAFQFFDCAPPADLRHSALGDAIATKDLLIKILKQLG